MGANLVTAYWDPSNIDDSLKTSLKNIALRHGASVDVHPNLDNYKQGKSRFSAEISGFSIPWKGGQEASTKILYDIKEEWTTKLRNFEVKGVSVTVYSLPM
jgi:hypothetical protein